MSAFVGHACKDFGTAACTKHLIGCLFSYTYIYVYHVLVGTTVNNTSFSNDGYMRERSWAFVAREGKKVMTRRGSGQVFFLARCMCDAPPFTSHKVLTYYTVHSNRTRNTNTDTTQHTDLFTGLPHHRDCFGGHCDCAPGVGGAGCDRCLPGFWPARRRTRLGRRRSNGCRRTYQCMQRTNTHNNVFVFLYIFL